MVERTDAHPPTISVSEQELAVLARIAGLRIAKERLPALARELTVTLQFATDLDVVLQETVVPVVLSFDPAWPTGEGTGR